MVMHTTNVTCGRVKGHGLSESLRCRLRNGAPRLRGFCAHRENPARKTALAEILFSDRNWRHKKVSAIDGFRLHAFAAGKSPGCPSPCPQQEEGFARVHFGCMVMEVHTYSETSKPPLL